MNCCHRITSPSEAVWTLTLHRSKNWVFEQLEKLRGNLEFRCRIALSGYQEVQNHEEIAQRIADLAEFKYVLGKFDIDDMAKEADRLINKAVAGHKMSGKARSESREYVKKAIFEWHEVRRQARIENSPLARATYFYIWHNALVFLMPYLLAALSLSNHWLGYLQPLFS